MDTLEKYKAPALGLFRIVVGFMFMCHGLSSLFGLFGGEHLASFGEWPGWYAAIIQFVGGGLVMLGLFTRVAAIVAAGSMAYAYFVVHQATGLLPIENKGEPSAMYCWAFLLIAVLGSGAFALESVFSRTSKKAAAPAPQQV